MSSEARGRWVVLLGAVLVSCALLEPPAPGIEERACGDEIDNDGDGRVDYPADEGCDSDLDPDEDDPSLPRACSDGVDNDGDGFVDYDQNGNGVIDADDDRGCDSAADDDESNVRLPECNDLVDNDRDGAIDLDDAECSSRNDPSESE